MDVHGLALAYEHRKLDHDVYPGKKDWREACTKIGMPENRFSDVRKTLFEGGFIREEYGFVEIS